MNTFIITFRESLEASLIIGIIYTILHRKQLSSHIKFLWFGLLAAIVSSVVFALLLEWINKSIENESIEKLTEGLLMVVTAGFVYYVIFWLSKHVSSKENIESDTLKSTAKTMGVFWMVYFTVLREGFETVMFLFSGSKMDESNFYLNFFAGILLACGIGYLIFVQGKRLNLRKFFKVTSFLLVIFASGMVAYGIHEIEEFFVKSRVAEINNEWKEWEPNSLTYLKHLDYLDSTLVILKKSNPETKQDVIRKVFAQSKVYPKIIESKIDFSKSYNYKFSKDKNQFSHDYQILRVWDILKPISQNDESTKANYKLKVKNYKNGFVESKFYHNFHDKGSIGGVLKGFTGYNSNPNWIEFIMWILSFGFGFYLWKKS